MPAVASARRPGVAPFLSVMSRSASGTLAALAALTIAACDRSTPPAAGSACGIVTADQVAEAFGARARGEPRGENGCLWTPRPDRDSAGTRRLLVEVVSPERIAAAGFADAETYLLVAAPQVGIAFGGEAEEIAGIGDRAVLGGGPDGGELWILDGDRLIGLVGEGVDRAAILRLARGYRRTTHSPT
jgi:hypothetical protein